MGRVPGTDQYRNIERFEGLQTYEDKLIVRFDAQLFFANTDYFRDNIESNLAEKPKVKYLVLDMRAVNGIDSSAIHMLKDLVAELREEGKDLHMVNVKGPVRDILKKNHFTELMGEDHFHMKLQNAMDYIDHGAIQSDVPYTLQSDFVK
jgi:SulP family sulfate permease